MDYFNYVLSTFLGLVVALQAGSESSRILSKNMFICVLKMDDGLAEGLEQYEVE